MSLGILRTWMVTQISVTMYANDGEVDGEHTQVLSCVRQVGCTILSLEQRGEYSTAK